MKKVVTAGAARAPVGSSGGTSKVVPAVKSGVIVAKEAIKRVGIGSDQVGKAVIGDVSQAGLGQNITRQVVLGAGCPITTPAMTLNKVCGSGLRAISLAAQMTKAGDIDIILAGGTEPVSCSPYITPDVCWGAHMNNKKIVDEMIKDGPWDAFNDYHMGTIVENIAKKYNTTHEVQDQLAIVSQNHAEKARAEGLFDEEIVPIEVKGRKETKVINRGEYIRDRVTPEDTPGLRPAFLRDGSGTVTTASASGTNDSAAMLIITSEEKAKELGIKPLATIVDYTSADVDPTVMGTGPIPFFRKALEESGWEIRDVNLIEANKAFTAQVNAVVQELQLDMDKISVNGGAIAIGHPTGASGARILTTLLYAMKHRDAKKDLAALCIGDGMGMILTVGRD